MADSTKPIFLSYASQDAAAALRICEALRAAGLEVWFDQSELRGGDTWDHKIRKQIKECALFVPIISASTNARPEGYFRLEWKLAVDRSHLLADDHPFLFPVVIDDTAEPTARVPEKFRDVQWTRLSVKDTPETLAVRVGRLLGGEMEPGRPRPGERGEGTASPRKSRQPTWLRYAWAGVGLLFAVVYAIRPVWQATRHAEARPVPAAPSAPVAAPAAASTQPSEARQLAEKAQELFLGLDSTKDDFALAEDMLKQAVAKAPGDADVWATYAQLHLRYGARGWDSSNERREAAWTTTQRALRLDPHSFEARFAAAGYFTGTAKETAEHEPALRALLKERPDDQRVLRGLGGLLRFQPGHLEEALQFYDRSAQLPGGDPLALYNKALALWFVGRTREAQEALAASLAQQPFIGSRLMNAFFALSLTGDLDRAQSLLAELPAAVFLEDRGCYFGYLVYRYRNEPDRALAFVQDLSRDWLNDNWFRGPRGLLAGNALAQAGRLEAATVEWRTALKVVDQRLAANPNDLVALGNRAILLGSLGDVTAARALLPTLRQMLQVDKPDVITQTWFAQACLLAGERAEAMRHIEMTLKTKLHASYYTVSDLRHDPTLAPLRGDPEFDRLIAYAEQVERADSGERNTGAAVSTAIIDDKSVAVLAFANLSDDKGNEYFSDGISEELLNVLAKVPGLKVTARTSSFHFKGKDTSIAEIAQQLGVAYVVEGSVRKAGDRVRITAQLVKAADGFQVWSDQFDRELKDVFAVQDEIAGVIAKNLSLKLGASSVASTAAVNPRAFELYVQGREAWNLRNNAGFARAEQLLNEAIALAPNFARAHAALADVWYMMAVTNGINGTFGRRDPPEFDRIRAEIQRALALDPDSAEAYASLGNLYFSTWRFAEAEQELRRAVALNPNYASAHQWLAPTLFTAGRLEEALAEIKRASELDPLSSRIADNYSYALFIAGRYSAAVAMNERALTLQPSNAQAQAERPIFLAYAGRKEEAVAAARQLPPDKHTLSARLITYAKAGLRAEAEALLPIPTDTSLWHPSYEFLVLGKKEEAITTLDVDSCDSPGTFGFAEYDAIDDDPRFQKFIAALGWTEARARIVAYRKAHPPEKPEAKQ